MPTIAHMPLSDNLDLLVGTGTATFTRSTTATFVDKIDGLIKTAAADVARFETEGVLLEGASTNLLLGSEEFDDASWSKLRASVTANDIASPDGTTTADKLTVDSTSASTHLVQSNSISFTSGNTYTKSVYAKAGNGSGAGRYILLETDSFARWSNDGHVRFDLVNGVVQGGAGSVFSNSDFKMESFGNGWFRCSINMICASTGSAAQEIQMSDGSASTNFDGNGTDFIYIWGGQVEEANDTSSYIPTTSASVTRASDNLSIDAANIPDPDAEYSIGMTFDLHTASSAANPVLLKVEGETQRRIFGVSSPLRVRGDHSAPVDTGTLAEFGEIEYIFAKSSAAIKTYVNSVLVSANTPGTVTGTKTSISIGSDASDPTSYLFGHIRDLKIYDHTWLPSFISPEEPDMITKSITKQALIGATLIVPANELASVHIDAFVDVISLSGLGGTPVIPSVGTYEIYVQSDLKGGFKSISDNGSLAAGKTGGSALADGLAEGASFRSQISAIKIVPTGVDVAVAYEVIIRQASENI